MKHDWIYLGMNWSITVITEMIREKMEVLLLKTYFEATVELNHLWIWIEQNSTLQNQIVWWKVPPTYKHLFISHLISNVGDLM
jgi:hypothetical protein